MRTRTVEIPLCELDTRDGVPLKVTDPRTGQTFVIVRCEAHIARMAQEAASENGNGAEPPERLPIPRLPRASGSRRGGTGLQGLDDRSVALLRAVVQEPGLPPREYASRVGLERRVGVHRGTTLRQRGLITSEGQRERATWLPLAAGIRAVAEAEGIELPEQQPGPRLSPGRSRRHTEETGVDDLGPGTLDILREVLIESGLHPREYAAKLGIGHRLASSRAISLRDRGLITAEGRRSSVTWHITERGKDAARARANATPEGLPGPRRPRGKKAGRKAAAGKGPVPSSQRIVTCPVPGCGARIKRGSQSSHIRRRHPERAAEFVGPVGRPAKSPA